MDRNLHPFPPSLFFYYSINPNLMRDEITENYFNFAFIRPGFR